MAMTERIGSAAPHSGGPPPSREETRAHRPMPAAIAALWERFKETNFARLTVLELAATAVLEDTLDDHLRRRAEAEAHKLAGAVGTFGFAEGSRVAREIEYLLKGAAPLQQAETLRLSELVVTLRQELERPPAGESPVVVRAAASPRLLIISEDAGLAELLAVEASGRGMEAAAVTGLSEGTARLASDCPDLVLLDLPRTGADEAGRRFLADLMKRTPPVPALVLAGEDSILDRVEVARLGGRAFLQKPVPAASVIEAAARVVQQRHPPEARVLVVGDDPQLVAVLHALLEPQGLHMITLSDPLRFWDSLEEVSPDILVLDVETPHGSRIELLQVVRNDPRWAALPVLFVTADTDPDTVRRIFASGADDVVSKPVIGTELAARILNRLERTRVLRSMTSSDGLTGAASHRKLRDRVLVGGPPLDRGRMTESLDVVVVEDDETTAGLLLHALQTRGYRTRWFRDGPTAADALESPGSPDQARVVLLDVDLPGLDGISVLRRMARSGVLSRTRVIMLTVRASEAEVLAALELGAVDHVAKPFSLPVLMQRVRRALRT